MQKATIGSLYKYFYKFPYKYSYPYFYIFFYKCFYRCFLCLLSMVVDSNLSANPKIPLVQSISANKVEYLAYIHIHGEYEPYHKTAMKEALSRPSQWKELRLHLMQAQENYLNHDLDNAKIQFEKVTNLAHHADWNDEHRLVIYYSFLRRAQWAHSKKERDKLITQALELDHHFQPDPKLFSEKLRLNFKRIQKNYQWAYWNPKKIHKSYNVIKMNGKKVSLSNEKIKIPQGILRLSLFSDTLHSQSVRIRGKNLASWQPIKKALAHGGCTHGEVQNFPWPVYFSKHCIYEPSKELKLSDLTKATAATSHSLTNPPGYPTLLSLPKGSESHKEASSKGSSPLLKNKWLWIAVGTVTLGWLHLQQRHSKKTTSHSNHLHGPSFPSMRRPPQNPLSPTNSSTSEEKQPHHYGF